MTTERINIFRILKRILLLSVSSVICLLLMSCDKKDPDPPVQPMYGVPAGEYINIDQNDNVSDVAEDMPDQQKQ